MYLSLQPSIALIVLSRYPPIYHSYLSNPLILGHPFWCHDNISDAAKITVSVGYMIEFFDNDDNVGSLALPIAVIHLSEEKKRRKGEEEKRIEGEKKKR